MLGPGPRLTAFSLNGSQLIMSKAGSIDSAFLIFEYLQYMA